MAGGDQFALDLRRGGDWLVAHSTTGDIGRHPSLDFGGREIARGGIDDATGFTHGFEQFFAGRSELFELHVGDATALGQIAQDALAYRLCLVDDGLGLFPHRAAVRSGGARIAFGGRRSTFDAGP